MFLSNGGYKWSCGDSRYLRFMYNLRRSKGYRRFAGLFHFLAVAALAALAYGATNIGLLWWFLESQLSLVVMTAIAMRSFTAPKRPKFDYTTEEFTTIVFKRTEFSQSTLGFATALSTALMQSSRGRSDAFKDLLAKPSEFEKTRNILTEKHRSGTGGSAWKISPEDLVEMSPRQAALAVLRPLLQPVLQRNGLDWADVDPILDDLTVEDLKKAKDDPKSFFEDRVESFVPLARKMLIFKLRPKLEPKLKQRGLTWQGLLAVMDKHSIDDLKTAIDDPETFLNSL